MKITIPVLALALILVSACSLTEPVEQTQGNQREYAKLLQQQNIRLAMQEEYLAQLAESQLELATTLKRIDEQTRDIKTNLSRSAAQEENPPPDNGQEPAAESIMTVAPPKNKIIVGRNEWVWLDSLGRHLKARIDTGVLSSSLNAVDLQPFERDGRDWIRFRVPDEDHPEGGDVYEAPLVKHVKIRQAAVEDLERRPVVRLQVRMGEHVDHAEFNLTDRENMLYPLLLGRNFLRDIMLVDVAQKFTQDKYRPDDPVADAQ